MDIQAQGKLTVCNKNKTFEHITNMIQSNIYEILDGFH